jgi:hypothetical protein
VTTVGAPVQTQAQSKGATDFAATVMMARRALAEQAHACFNSANCVVPEDIQQLLCEGEAPEGPGRVDDVEHIPGTHIIG